MESSGQTWRKRGGNRWAKKQKKPEDKSLTDMKCFHRTTDWAALWEEWFLALDPSGRPRWKTTWQFARAKAKSVRQQGFLVWYLGPSTDPMTGLKTEPASPDFSFVSPQDWTYKRETGGWYTDRFTKEFAKKIAAEHDALDAARTMGQEIFTPSLERYERMAKTLDRNLNFGEFDPEKSDRENFARAKLYIEFHAQIENLKAKAADWWFKSRGMNFDQPSTFAELISVQALIGQRTEQKISRTQLLVQKFAEMTMAKAAEFRLPLPKEMEDKIVEVASQPMDDEPKKVN